MARATGNGKDRKMNYSAEKIVSTINTQAATVAEIAHSLWLKPDGIYDYQRMRSAWRAGEQTSDEQDQIMTSETDRKYDSACAGALAEIVHAAHPDISTETAKNNIVEYYSQTNDAPRYAWRNILETVSEITDRQRNSSAFWKGFLDNSGWYISAIGDAAK